MALLAEELARASGGIAVSPLVSAYMAAPHIAMYGSAEQRAAYLPGLARGRRPRRPRRMRAAAGSAVARHYRDVRVLRIGGGADEIQLEILSRELAP